MVVRKRKKKNKLRGKRYHSHGDTKNRRGAGCRGGRGRAGSKKHKFSKYYTDFGTKIRLNPKFKDKEIITINLNDLSQVIDRQLQEGKAVKEKDFIVIDGTNSGYTKILGRGNLKHKVLLRNVQATKKATEKIISAKGKVEGIEETDLEAEAEEFEAEEQEE